MQPDSRQSHLIQLELALTIGRTQTLELAERCREFLYALMQRRNVGYGGIWVRSSTLNGGRHAADFELVVGVPEARVQTRAIAAGHPVLAELERASHFVVRSTDAGFHDYVLEESASPGAVATLRLGENGFLRLCSLDEAIFSKREINQLSSVLEVLAISIEGALAVQNMQAQAAEISALNERLSAQLSLGEETQRALTEAQLKFRDYLDASADWFWEMDADLRFSAFSDRFEDAAGLPPSALLGKTRQETGIPGVDPVQWETHLAALRERRPFSNFIHPRMHPEKGRVWLSINGVPAFEDGGDFIGFRGTGRDVTEIMAAQDALRAALESAEQANAAKSAFLSSMSHELRTPLNSILGFGQLLADDPADPLSERHQEFIERILKNGQHLLALINQVLDLSRVESGSLPIRIESDSAASVVEDCVAMSQPLARELNIELMVDGAVAGLPACRFDHTQLRQVLLNLISNAIKYNRPGGRVAIGGETRPNRTVRLSVRDTGHGIAEEMRPHLFEPFNRLGRENSNIQGSGIGLTIAKHLLDLMKGVIGYESQVGEGSCFWIELPMAPSES